jgi:phosphohistidine phosphatase
MLTLSLFRHAKSSRNEPELEDFDRPLSPRGRKAAPRMAAFMRDNGIYPDLVLCSPSRRTRETWALISGALRNPPTRYSQELYLATPETMLDCIRATGPDVGHLMLVGHNPGTQQLAVNLIGSADRQALKALAAKFPTAGLAVITFETGAWRSIRPATGHLSLFMTPKRLP